MLNDYQPQTLRFVWSRNPTYIEKIAICLLVINAPLFE